jgi:hypothetical protein
MFTDLLTITEHKSSSYAPRTYHNASVADLTIAFAVDFTTAGERLTKKAAGEKYAPIALQLPTISAARLVWCVCNKINPSVLNIAGNGIYTLNLQDVNQEQVNQHIYDVLKQATPHLNISKIVSGGQTGADLAGGVAGIALGIPVEMTLPRGFKQRHEDGLDVEHTREEIVEQVRIGVEGLKL